MGKKDKRVDAYIANAQDFAKPILIHLRAIVHETCPDVEETIKWSSPFFEYAGSTLCMMTAFKQHAGFGFWQRKLVVGDAAEGGGPNQFGRLTQLSDLPSKRVLAAYLKKAMQLNDAGIKTPRSAPKPKKPLVAPADLKAALGKNKKALAAFGKFPPSHQREYVEWITDAKTDATRQRRLTQAIEWIAEGKARNWKYM